MEWVIFGLTVVLVIAIALIFCAHIDAQDAIINSIKRHGCFIKGHIMIKGKIKKRKRI